jgi:endonuclease V-like protein UPF0215 family
MEIDRLKMIKKELRILGIDDAPFNKFKDKECLIVATIFRGGSYIDGLLSTHVKIDGRDSTENIIKIVRASRHIEQLRCIMIDGIAFAGFNVIDIQKVSKMTKLPVIVFIRKMPNFKKIAVALEKADKKTAASKLALMKKAGKVHRIKNKRVYYQIAGISEKKAAEILKLAATHAIVPEPLRIAHIIASGIALGESHGHA